MLDFLPWMDEVHIVKMGRNFLSSADAMDGTILSLANGMPYIPPYYLGPMIQELLFRIFGETGTRLSPLFAIVLSAISFSWFLKASNRYSRTSLVMTSLMTLTLPLIIQSARLVRIDAWVFFTCFLACGLLSRHKYKMAATIAALTPFIWPTAIMLFPLYLVVHLENSEKLSRLLAPILVALCVVAIMLIPLIHVSQIAAGSLSSYFATYGGCFTTGEEHNIIQQL